MIKFLKKLATKTSYFEGQITCGLIRLVELASEVMLP
jgi:hypothetical protein